MIPDRVELKRLLDFAVRLAREAGDITCRHFKGSFVAERKADNSFVTIADREAERDLRTNIERAFPDDGILGEEEGEKIGTTGRRWIIDPVDGTYSFVHGVPLYGVLIGLEIDGESELGVVNLPALNEIVCAARGLGCFWNGAPARVSATQSLAEALLLATDFGTCEQYGFGQAAEALARQVDARRTWGDAYGHMLVATGRADIMLDPVMNVWDCAALAPSSKKLVAHSPIGEERERFTAATPSRRMGSCSTLLCKRSEGLRRKPMLVIPAIDLRQGKCIRLTQGRKNAATVYGDDPVKVAEDFERDGAQMLHVVDLDGAFAEPNTRNREVLRDIARAIQDPAAIWRRLAQRRRR